MELIVLSGLATVMLLLLDFLDHLQGVWRHRLRAASPAMPLKDDQRAPWDRELSVPARSVRQRVDRAA